MRMGMMMWGMVSSEKRSGLDGKWLTGYSWFVESAVERQACGIEASDGARYTRGSEDEWAASDDEHGA